MPGHTANLRLKLPLICAFLQLPTTLLFAVFVRYDDHTSAKLWHDALKLRNVSHADHAFYARYPSFQDVHTMIFIGFGFLMTFLKRYSFSSVAFNFLIAAFAIQWSILVQGFLHSFHNGKIYVGLESMINADFCSGAVLISFGALLSKTSPVQLLLMTGFEVTLFGINEYILLSLLGAKDAGGSMTIHTFGAYFGLMVSRILYRPNLGKSRQAEGSTYHSDLFAMIGTLFLWLFWPSFNSALTAHGDDQQRTVINTYFSLAASTLAAFATSALMNQGGKLDMVHIQNAALAGGVIVGTAGEMMLMPFGAMIAGILAGFVATLGFKFLTPILASRMKIQDTCGVHNLHGMPGVLGALLGALVAAMATPELYGDGMADVFPLVASGGRTAVYQSFLQLIGLLVTLGIAVIGGSLVGYILQIKRNHHSACSAPVRPHRGRCAPFQVPHFRKDIERFEGTQRRAIEMETKTYEERLQESGVILKMKSLGSPPDTQCFEDQIYWEVPEDHHKELQHTETLNIQESDGDTRP